MKFIRDGEKVWGVGGVWRSGFEGDYIPIATLSPVTRMTQEGSDESHFNVSLIVRDKVTRQCPQSTTFFEEKGQPNRNRAKTLLLTSLNVLPLGQTGSLNTHIVIPTLYVVR